MMMRKMRRKIIYAHIPSLDKGPNKIWKMVGYFSNVNKFNFYLLQIVFITSCSEDTIREEENHKLECALADSKYYI